MYINSNDKADTLRRNMKENESMKKWIALTLALVLALSLFAGCGKGVEKRSMKNRKCMLFRYRKWRIFSDINCIKLQLS